MEAMEARASHIGAFMGEPDGASGDDIYIGIDADVATEAPAKAEALARILDSHN
jgi:hypothetical protein